MSSTGQKIRLLREQKGLSALQLAQAIGREGKNISQGIYDIETGKVKRIKMGDIVKIAKALDVDPEVLMDKCDGDTESAITILSEPPQHYRNGPGQESLERKYIAALEEITRLQRQLIELQNKK